MWCLIYDNLRYRWVLVLSACGALLFLGAVIHVVLPALWAQDILPRPDRIFSVLNLYPLLTLLAFLIAATSAQAADSREDRLRAHGVLPLTKAQVGMARMLMPVAFMLPGLALSLLMMAVIYVGWGKGNSVACIGVSGWFLFVLQGTLLIAELEAMFPKTSVLRPIIRVMVPVTVGLVILLFMGGIDIASLQGIWILYGGSGLLITLNFLIFMRRKSLLD